MIHIKEIESLLANVNEDKPDAIINAVNEIEKKDLQWDHSIAVHFLRNYTLENISIFIRYFGYKKGIKASVSFSDYDAYFKDILDGNSNLYQSKIDLVVLTLSLDNLPISFDKNGLLQVNEIIEHIKELICHLKANASFAIAISTFVIPFNYVKHVKGVDYLIKGLDEVNLKLKELVKSDNRLMMIDISHISRQIGYENTFDLRYWFMFKAPFKNIFLKALSEELIQFMAVLKGRIKKVLVLDCDNTLWGGIVGEDGLMGIKLSPNDFPGNVFYCFQKQVLTLQKSGILLALCSKNNEDDVFEVLDKHSHCLIKRENIVSWKINWKDKVTNIREISQELNLGLDSFVFIDDNPAECQLVAAELPMVDVIQVPTKVYELTKILGSYDGFTRAFSTIEDFQLTEQYHLKRVREEEARKFENFDDYIASLEIEVEVAEAAEDDLQRVVQLTQKTNQFNLTTRRYMLGEIEKYHKSKDFLILVLKAKDKYGDYGLTGLCILKHNHNECHIDTFLLSCRILGRKLEDVFLNEAIKIAIGRWNPDVVKAEYIETQKNSQTKEFYEGRGFSCISNSKTNKLYDLLLSYYVESPIKFIKVCRR